jgi:thiol-disulfide isomerase/thioredoxin
MKNLIAALVLMCGVMVTNGQTPYTCSPDPEHPGGKIYNGIITKYALINDTSFQWYKASQQIYTPKAQVLEAMIAAKGKYKFILFGGSWCDDTQFILPKFFKLQELAAIPDSDISFIGVDRNKSSLGNLASIFNVQNVPSIIVMKDGKEAGRVVEYGKTGEWDKELAELLK